MSSNLLNKSGVMAGIDFHTYITIGPLGVPVPVPFCPHVVGGAHFLISRLWRIAFTVTTDGWATLQNNWALMVFTHVPEPAGPPHPTEGANIAIIVITSSSAPQLSAHSVTVEKQAVLTAIYSAFGLNLDCGTVPSPTGVDLNLNTVVTTPTLGDYLSAVLGALLSSAYGTVTGAVFGGESGIGLAILQNLADGLYSNHELASFLLDPPQWVINKLTGLLQGWVDGPH